MTESVKDSVTTTAAALLIHYSFDLHGHTADELVVWWATAYQSHWIRSAVVEALYQGRYKAISVEQILAFWSRRGQPLYHFNHEFERIVCSKFPQALVPKPSSEETTPAIAPLDTPLRIDWPALPPSLPPAAENLEAIPPLSFADPEDEVEPPKPMWRSLPAASPVESADPIPAATSTAPQPTTAGQEPSIAPNSLENNAASVPHEAQLPDLATVIAEAEQLLANLPFNAPAETSVDRSEVAAIETPELDGAAAVGQAKQAPIHQFVPNSKTSDFYAKLKAVAQSPEEVRAAAED